MEIANRKPPKPHCKPRVKFIVECDCARVQCRRKCNGLESRAKFERASSYAVKQLRGIRLVYALPDLLSDIVDGAAVPSVEVTGVNADSRQIGEGDVFFALPGAQSHGDAYSAQAVKNGAVAIVSDRAVEPDPGIATVVVEDVRAAYAKAAAKVSGPQPDVIVAVTGTSGKTSVASYVRQLWAASGIKGASIGTLGVDTGGGVVAGALTTPDSLTLHKSLAALKAGGIDHVIIEASSHGLDQRRMDGLSFKVAAFTNLSHDHLDYHADMDEYREAKLRLFRELLVSDGASVVNSDDPEHMPFMFASLDAGVSLLTVGEEGAYLAIESVEAEGAGHRVKGKLVGEPLDCLVPLAGRFQVDNVMLALSIALQTGADLEKMDDAIEALQGAKGRLEHVADHNDAAVFVDYAHKPAALEAALTALRETSSGKLSVVFGCGGDRDATKRPEMGEIAARLADVVIVTDDNPRTEDAAKIRAEIMATATGATEISDRAEAIQTAMDGLSKGDVLVIAGKGHEDYQIIGTEKHAFSDHDVVRAKAAS